MKRGFIGILFFCCYVVGFSQYKLDSVPAFLQGDLDGFKIEKEYSFASTLLYAGTQNMQPRGTKQPAVIIKVFYRHPLAIAKQFPWEVLHELRDFDKDTDFLKLRRPDKKLNFFSAIGILDSSGVFVTASGIDSASAKDYEFHVLKNKTEEVVPWSNIKLFCPVYEERTLPNGKDEEQVAYLGQFSTGFGNNLTVDVRRKGTVVILSSITLIWVNRAPAVLGVFSSKDMRSFLSVFKDQWRRDVLVQLTSAERKAKDSLLVTKTVFAPGENNLIFYMDDKVQSKEVIEYNLVKGSDSTGWKTNDFDYNFIWLQNLSPGSYSLKIRYSVQRHNVSNYTFTIKPYWYQTVAFTITCVLLAAILIGFVILLVNARKQKQRLLVQQLENQKKQAQLKSVRHQLNPHFVFNAMASIQGLMNREDIDGANKYLSTFSNLMRDTLAESDEDFNTLAVEINLLKTYLTLEQLRFGFSFTIGVDEAINVEEVEMPSLLLQPLVENAVKHGVAAQYEKGKISIQFRKVGNNMVVTISDTGNGFSLQESNKGYGLKLTQERIALLNTLQTHRQLTMGVENNNTGVTVKIIFANWIE